MRKNPALLALALASCVATAQPKVGNDRAITPQRLKAHLEFIASDEMEGRDTPSRGLDVATLYVATQLKLWGAVPAGDNGGFFQTLRLTQRSLDKTGSTITVGGKTFNYGDGIKAAGSECAAKGRMVYAGHGYVFKAKGIDPYAGLDLKGKIVVVAMGLPKGASHSDMRGKEGLDYAWPALAAKSRGAAAVVTVASQDYLANWSPNRSTRLGGVSFEEDPAASTMVPTVTVGAEVAKAIFDGQKLSADEVMKGDDAPETGFELLSDKSAEVSVKETREVQTARNVVAIVPGSDPKLSKEFVAFGAHIDHLGMRTGGTGDRIYNGADDDGSGTVSILEIAHAFLTGPRPKRSCLFVWHCGEEKGLWGSTYFTDHPTVDLKNVVTQLNIDMIGRSKKPGDTNPANKVLTGPNEIYVVGSTKMSTDLQKTSEAVNRAFLNLKFDYKYDDPKDNERIFYRSDHYNYARKGVPIIFYFDGVHEDYHRPSDEVSKIDFEKMSKVARTVYATGWALANGAKRPVVDKPLKD